LDSLLGFQRAGECKLNLQEPLLKILQKYCNGEYGFEHPLQKQGTFQLSLIRVLVRQSNSFVNWVQLVQEGALQLLSQLAEEAVILIVEEWKLGRENATLGEFLITLLHLASLGLSKHCSEFLPQTGELITRVCQRLDTSLTKKQNQVLNHFVAAVAKDQQIVLSHHLSLIKEQSQHLRLRFEAISEYNEMRESHEEKHFRLFNQNINTL
jgi:hypothetical protein